MQCGLTPSRFWCVLLWIGACHVLAECFRRINRNETLLAFNEAGWLERGTAFWHHFNVLLPGRMNWREWQRVDRIRRHWLKEKIRDALRQIIDYKTDLIHGIRRNRLTCFVPGAHRRCQGDWRISRNNVRRWYIWIGMHEPWCRSIERSGRRRGICHGGCARDHRRRGLRRDKRHIIVFWSLSPSIWVRRSAPAWGARENRSQFFAKNWNGESNAVLIVREGIKWRAVDSWTNLMSWAEWSQFKIRLRPMCFLYCTVTKLDTNMSTIVYATVLLKQCKVKNTRTNTGLVQPLPGQLAMMIYCSCTSQKQMLISCGLENV